MKWVIAAPYSVDIESGLWREVALLRNSKTDLINSKANYHHNRSRQHTSTNEWLDYWNHSKQTWDIAQQHEAGIFTAFPQLATLISLKKRISYANRPLIAGTFNLGGLPQGVKQYLASNALQSIDKFIVHSSYERLSYSQYLNLPISKFEFIHLHRPILPITIQEDTSNPFILAVGSAKRDYATFIEAVKKLGYKTIIITAPHALQNIPLPRNVSVKSNLSISECRQMVQKARINIIPLDNKSTASGQVTVIEAMMLGKAIIATNSIGTIDYVTSDTGHLIKENDLMDMCNALTYLWENEQERKRLGNNARNFAIKEFSSKTAACKINKILDVF